VARHRSRKSGLNRGVGGIVRKALGMGNAARSKSVRFGGKTAIFSLSAEDRVSLNPQSVAQSHFRKLFARDSTARAIDNVVTTGSPPVASAECPPDGAKA
jgi:hypothetical protein